MLKTDEQKKQNAARCLADEPRQTDLFKPTDSTGIIPKCINI